jgi:hypothetical protein
MQFFYLFKDTSKKLGSLFIVSPSLIALNFLFKFDLHSSYKLEIFLF